MRDLIAFEYVLLTKVIPPLYRNESISKQFCPCFRNNSAINATQVNVIGQPVAWSPNRTKVDFAVILCPVSSAKPLVVLNTTLEHIIWERADSISKHLNKTVLDLPPLSGTRCNEVGVPTVKIGGKAKKIAIAIGIPFALVILFFLVAVAVWYR